MKIAMRKKDGVLVPLFNSDKKKYDSLSENEYWVEITKDRDIRKHNKLIALCRLFARNTSDERFSPYGPGWAEEDAAIDRILDALKHEIGWTKEVMKFDGEIIEEAKSIAFRSLSDEDEFLVKIYIPARKIFARLLECTEEEIEENAVFNE